MADNVGRFGGRDVLGFKTDEVRKFRSYRYERESYDDYDCERPLVTHKHELTVHHKGVESSEVTIKGQNGGEAYLLATTDNQLVLSTASGIFPTNELRFGDWEWNPVFQSIITHTMQWLEGGIEAADLFNRLLDLEVEIVESVVDTLNADNNESIDEEE